MSLLLSLAGGSPPPAPTTAFAVRGVTGRSVMRGYSTETLITDTLIVAPSWASTVVSAGRPVPRGAAYLGGVPTPPAVTVTDIAYLSAFAPLQRYVGNSYITPFTDPSTQYQADAAFAAVMKQVVATPAGRSLMTQVVDTGGEAAPVLAAPPPVFTPSTTRRGYANLAGVPKDPATTSFAVIQVPVQRFSGTASVTVALDATVRSTDYPQVVVSMGRPTPPGRVFYTQFVDVRGPDAPNNSRGVIAGIKVTGTRGTEATVTAQTRGTAGTPTGGARGTASAPGGAGRGTSTPPSGASRGTSSVPPGSGRGTSSVPPAGNRGTSSTPPGAQRGGTSVPPTGGERGTKSPPPGGGRGTQGTPGDGGGRK